MPLWAGVLPTAEPRYAGCNKGCAVHPWHGAGTVLGRDSDFASGAAGTVLTYSVSALES